MRGWITLHWRFVLRRLAVVGAVVLAVLAYLFVSIKGPFAARPDPRDSGVFAETTGYSFGPVMQASLSACDSGRAPAAFRSDSTSAAVAFTGRIVGTHGRPQGGVEVVLSVLGRENETLWSAVFRTADAILGSSGVALPDVSGRYCLVYPGAPRPDAVRYRLLVPQQKMLVGWLMIAGKPRWNFVETIAADSVDWSAGLVPLPNGRATVIDLPLRFDTAAPSYTGWLFAPALVGLLAAVLVFVFQGLAKPSELRTPTMSPAEVQRERVWEGWRRQKALLWYASAGTCTWVYVIGIFIAGYVKIGLKSITLFDSSLHIPVLVPVAAFLGVLVYATDRLVKVPKDPAEQLAELGNRVFVAPYVALIAILALFQGRSESLLLPAFVAFVTGLWIEPVLSALRVAGEKLIPGGDSTESASQSAIATGGERQPGMPSPPHAIVPPEGTLSTASMTFAVTERTTTSSGTRSRDGTTGGGAG